MKKIYSILLLVSCLFSMQAQRTRQDALNPIEQKKISLPAFESNEISLRNDQTQPVDYTQGVFILNEDWFGHNNSTMNFMKAGSHDFVYRVYQRENPGKTFGCTSQYGTIFGENLFIMSKQAKDPGDTRTGGRLIVADAKTLKSKLVLEEIGGGDGRAFLGVNDSVGYVGTSGGIYVFDSKNLQLKNIIEGSNNTGGLYNGQIGLMVRTKTYVFAIRQAKGVFVIDPKTHQIIKTIPGNYSTLTQSKDGMVWVGAGKKLLRIDPETLDEEIVNLPNDLAIPDSWYAWTAGVLCASIQENALYFTTGAGFFSGGKIWRYEIGNPASLDNPLYEIPEKGRKLYTGAGFRVGPDEKLYLSVFEEFGSVNYWQYIVDAKTGAELGKYKQERAYWFPAMHIFPDVAPPVVSEFTPVKKGINSDPLVLSLKGMATDADNLDEAIYKSVKSVSDPSLVTASIFGDKLTLAFAPNKTGDAIVTVNFDSNGKIVTKDLHITIESSAFYLDKHSATLAPDATLQLTASGSDPVVWESRDNTVATVENGLVTAKGKGKTMIVATAGNLKDSCAITVEVAASLTSLSFAEVEKTIQRDSSYQLEVKHEPADASITGLIWESDNGAIAHVNKTGKVTALKDGKAVIKVFTPDNALSASCNITVRADLKGISLQETLVLNSNPKGFRTSQQLKPVLTPARPTNPKITWKSSDQTIATVNAQGTVKAVKAGEATITATTVEGNFSAECKVTCRPLYNWIKPETAAIALSPGGTAQIKLKVSPDTIKTPFVYTSDDPEVVTVDASGKLTAGNKHGKATITIQPDDGSTVKTECKVSVGIPVERIILNRDTVRQVAETTYQLKYNIYPDDATFKDVVWKSTKMSPVRVSSDGVVSFVRIGESNVIATPEYGGIADTCVIIVVDKAAVPVTSITLNQTELTLEAKSGTTYDGLKATLEPANPTYPEIVWHSSNEAVARVDKHTGIITPLKTGTAEISASVTDGLSQTCLVTVIKKIEKISLNMNNAEVEEGKTLQLKAVIQPEDAIDQTLQWTSSDNTVALVNQQGLVSALKKGEAKIYVTSVATGIKDSCLITVRYIDVSEVQLSHQEAEMKVRETFTLKATVSPVNATEKGLVWSSSDEYVASVTSEGVVHALNVGKTIITVSTISGNKKATCELTVKEWITITVLPKLEVSGTDLKLIFEQIDEATAYELSLYKYVGNQETLVRKCITDAEGKITSELKSGSYNSTLKMLNFSFTDLDPETAYAVKLVAIKESGKRKEVLYTFTTERKSTTVGNMTIDDANRHAYYHQGTLYLKQMNGYRCSIVCMEGRIADVWEEKHDDTTRIIQLPAGIYTFTAIKGHDQFTHKFVVK